MQFCVISPAAGLQRWATLSRAHLVLAHVKNALYEQFYRQRSDEGDLIILDNSAYEGKVNEDRLVETIGLYHPKVVILPDILMGDAHESYELAQAFHKKWKSRLPIEWMFVPQGKNVPTFIEYMQRGVEEIQPEWIGIPRVYGTHLYPDPPDFYSRAELCELIHLKWPNINVHALGMLAGNVKELELLEKVNCTSIDSSAPVWRGWNGFNIENPEWANAGCDVDFDAYPSTKHDDVIIANLRKCGVNV